MNIESLNLVFIIALNTLLLTMFVACRCCCACYCNNCSHLQYNTLYYNDYFEVSGIS